ncbi:MAG: class I SAM-dependent methyltransferase [Dehalococcoidia bacterium]|nr:class I SAM-dependent methyltransferase [Dehalococcoidia bacterium]
MARVDYDRMAPRFDEGRALSPDALAGWRDALAPYLPPAAGLPVVDVGSGTGRFAGLLSDWFDVRVAGIEPSAGMRRAAQRPAGHGNVSYAGGDAQHLPLRGASCGAAWLSTVIHHIPDLAACARELRRVLAPNAPVLVRSWFPGRDNDLTQWRYFPGARRIAETFPSVDATVDAFATAGFAMEALESVPQVSAPGLRALADRIRTRADTTLELLSDEEFERGLAELERDAARETAPRPVVNRLDLLVVR